MLNITLCKPNMSTSQRFIKIEKSFKKLHIRISNRRSLLNNSIENNYIATSLQCNLRLTPNIFCPIEIVNVATNYVVADLLFLIGCNFMNICVSEIRELNKFVLKLLSSLHPPFLPHFMYFISSNNNFYIQVLPYLQAKLQSKKNICKANRKEREISLRAANIVKPATTLRRHPTTVIPCTTIVMVFSYKQIFWH